MNVVVASSEKQWDAIALCDLNAELGKKPEYHHVFECFVELQLLKESGTPSKKIKKMTGDLVKLVNFVRKYTLDPVLDDVLVWCGAEVSRREVQKSYFSIDSSYEGPSGDDLVTQLLENPEYELLSDEFISLQLLLQQEAPVAIVKKAVRTLLRNISEVKKYGPAPLLDQVVVWCKAHKGFERTLLTPKQKKILMAALFSLSGLIFVGAGMHRYTSNIKMQRQQQDLIIRRRAAEAQRLAQELERRRAAEAQRLAQELERRRAAEAQRLVRLRQEWLEEDAFIQQSWLSWLGCFEGLPQWPGKIPGDEQPIRCFICRGDIRTHPPLIGELFNQIKQLKVPWSCMIQQRVDAAYQKNSAFICNTSKVGGDEREKEVNERVMHEGCLIRFLLHNNFKSVPITCPCCGGWYTTCLRKLRDYPLVEARHEDEHVQFSLHEIPMPRYMQLHCRICSQKLTAKSENCFIPLDDTVSGTYRLAVHKSCKEKSAFTENQELRKKRWVKCKLPVLKRR